MSVVDESEASFERNKTLLVNLLTAARDGDVASFRKHATTIATETKEPVATVLCGWKDGLGRSALHFASNFGHRDVCEAVLDLAPGALTLADNDGATPVHLATLGDKVDVLRLLIERGATLDTLDTKGHSALFLCGEHDYPEAAAILLEGGADANVGGPPGIPLLAAASEGSIRTLKVLLPKTTDLNAASASGFTALIAAAAAGFVKCTETLTEAGSDVSVQGPAGLTALHFAVQRGNLAMCNTLLAGTNGEAAARTRNTDGLMPVQLAAGDDHADIVEVLFPVSGLTDVTVPELMAAEKERAAKEASSPPTAAGGASGGAAPPLPPAAASEADAAAAMEHKNKGNADFVAGRYAESIVHYTNAIQLNGREHTFWSNRSASYLKLDRFQEALQDAQMCRTIKPDWAKAYMREGQALLKLNRFEDAAVTFYSGVKLDSSSDALADAFKKAVRLGKKHHQETGKTQE